MEAIRKRMMEEGAGELFQARGSKDRMSKRPSTPPKSVISISDSDESFISSKSSSQPIIIGSDDDDVDDDDVGSGSDQQVVVVPKVRTARRVILDSDDEDDDDFPIARTLVAPVPERLATVTNTVNNPPTINGLPKVAPIKPSAPQPFRNDVSRPAQSIMGAKSPTAIRAPTLDDFPDLIRPQAPTTNKSSDAAKWETFAEPDTFDLYDPKKSADDAEKDLKDLVAESMNDTTEEVDMSFAEVEGFRENIKLLPHQVIGRKWMAERENGKKTGGILADDMGLGKTIQTLTRIVDNRPNKSDKKDGYATATLVVCPVSLVSQWASEVHKMAVGLRVVEHHGPSRTRDPDILRRAHVVVTSYSIVASEYAAYLDESKAMKFKSKKAASESDSDADHFGRVLAKNKKTTTKTKKKVFDALFQVNWWRIVLDEAHNIKNRKTKAAIACCALESKYRWCLTGTPLQNNVEELFSLLQFLRTRPLNDWDTFNHQINKPVKAGRSGKPMKRLHIVLKAIMLRRRKDSLLNGKPIIELPDRIVEVVPCEFDDEEMEFYQALQEKVELTLNKFVKSGDVMKNYTCVMVLLLRLRQACNHPSLVSKVFTADKEAVEPKAAKGNDLDDGDDLADLFGNMGLAADRKCQLCHDSLTPKNTNSPDDVHCDTCLPLAMKSRRKSQGVGSLGLPPDSAKIRMIIELLEKIEERDGEEKTIIFSQFTSMLDLIQPFLRHAGIKYVRYDGSMKKDDREIALEKIRTSNSIKVILISFKAGSTGLNLTACNNVILVDMWWNPALEDQAFDRAHRFGQKRNVNIFKLTIENTVEERILKLQESKRELAKAALSGDKLAKGKNGGGLGMDELMALFKPGRDDDDDD